MKIEIIREQEFNKPEWYILKVNNGTVECSRSLEEIETLYDQIKSNPEVLNNRKIVLKSEEIDVNL